MKQTRIVGVYQKRARRVIATPPPRPFLVFIPIAKTICLAVNHSDSAYEWHLKTGVLHTGNEVLCLSNVFIVAKLLGNFFRFNFADGEPKCIGKENFRLQMNALFV